MKQCGVRAQRAIEEHAFQTDFIGVRHFAAELQLVGIGRIRDQPGPVILESAGLVATREGRIGAELIRDAPVRGGGSREGAFLTLAVIMAVEPHVRSEEHTSELQSLMRISYAVFCLKKQIKKQDTKHD